MPNIPAIAEHEPECHLQVRVMPRTSCGLSSVTYTYSILAVGTDLLAWVDGMFAQDDQPLVPALAFVS